MKTLHLGIIVFLAASLVAVNNAAFADGSTSYGGLTGFRQAYFQGNHGSYPIWYKLTNGTAVSTLLDLPAKALLFMINTSSDGQLIVELPRSIIDSKNQNADKPYFVGVGGITTGLSQVNATETSDDYLRTLKIGFTKNTDEIEIVGTFFVENYSSITKHSSILLSPLKQFKSGITVKDVKCNKDLQFIMKQENAHFACVKKETANQLFNRGWGIYPSSGLHIRSDNSIIKSSGITMENQTHPIIDVVSIQMSTEPANPGGPKIQIMLKNNSVKSITSLNATLKLYNSYVFNFKDVTQSNPLTSGNSVSETEILIGGGFTSESTYPLTINGIADNIPFRYSENVTIPYTKEIVGNAIPASFEPCDTPYQQSDTGIAVLYIPINSTGKICLKYSNPSEPRNASITIFEARKFMIPADTVKVFASPNTILQGNGTITYTIISGNKAGFYGISLLCGGLPLAIGYDNKSNIVIDDFSWRIGQTFYCGADVGQISGLSGMGVKFIPFH